jgi:hypothetical protein
MGRGEACGVREPVYLMVASQVKTPVAACPARRVIGCIDNKPHAQIYFFQNFGEAIPLKGGGSQIPESQRAGADPRANRPSPFLGLP